MNHIIKVVCVVAALFTGVACYADDVEERQLEQFGRNIEQRVFVPKGQWIAGLSVSFSQSEQSNYSFLIVEGIDGDTYSFKASPLVCYMVKDDLGLGGKLEYSRNRVRMDRADIVLDSETDYSNENFYSISQGFSGMAVLRNYINLGRSKRFGIYNEVQLKLGYSESKLCNGAGNDFTGTFARSYSAGLAVAPGLVAFLNNYSALEVNVGVLGFNYSYTKQITDQVKVSHLHTKSANLRLNLLSISFGVAFYL
ncbi:MAG: hypothetical protein PUD91_00140 [Bacteroidales bacterium]|nr:hypothetical protein [Bacteroidales bacterium]